MSPPRTGNGSTTLIRSDRTDETAAYIAAASNPHYESAFAKIVSGPLGRLDWTAEERAAFEVVEATKVRQDLRQEHAVADHRRRKRVAPRLHRSPDQPQFGGRVRGDFRRFSRVETISGTHAWNGATSAGITAAWNTEGAETTDATPTISSAQIAPVRGDMYCEATYEMVADGPAFVQQLGMLFADGKYKLEQQAFATGAGGTTAPEGIVTRLLATTTSRWQQTPPQFGYVDVFDMPGQLPEPMARQRQLVRPLDRLEFGQANEPDGGGFDVLGRHEPRHTADAVGRAGPSSLRNVRRAFELGDREFRFNFDSRRLHPIPDR